MNLRRLFSIAGLGLLIAGASASMTGPLQPLVAKLYTATTENSEVIRLRSSEVRISDGDTIARDRLRIRLFGIDAPEKAQSCLNENRASMPCGAMARAHLELLIRGTDELTCTLQPAPDQYDRRIGRCNRSDGVEINRAMVSAGWALPYMQYGGAEYSREAASAREGRRGIHGMTYQAPAEYRRQNRHG